MLGLEFLLKRRLLCSTAGGVAQRQMEGTNVDLFINSFKVVSSFAPSRPSVSPAISAS